MQYEIQDQLIEDLMLGLGSEFDSHELILKLARENQWLYVSALAAINNQQPFSILHADLEQRIQTIGGRLGYTCKAWRSLDIFGQNNACILCSKS